MIYTNDETDKTERRKNFYLSVYLLPIMMALALCGILYWAYSRGYLNWTDFRYGCVLSLTPAAFLSGYNGRNWLKMPDGTYHNIKGATSINSHSLSEPAEYEAEFRYSKWKKASYPFMGLVVLGTGIWLSINGIKSYLIPIGSAFFGAYMCYNGIKGLMDNTSKLKIAKSGLWTKKLGFVNWDDINFAEVVVDTRGKTPQTYLEVRMKNTVYEQADKPDERLLLDDLQNKGDIEMMINDSIINYNKQKQESIG